MSLRIAMVGACPYPVPQGSQVFLRDNALALRARGHDVHLVVYGYGAGHDRSGLPIHRCARIPGARRVDAGPSLFKPFLDLAMVITLRRVVRQERIDIVFAHNYEALIVALACGRRPIVYHAHNAMSDELPYYFSGRAWAERVGRWLDHAFPRRADRVIAPQRRLAGHLIVRGCDHGKIEVVPPPLDASLFDVCTVGEALPAVLYTGNLDTYQNLGLLFSAMARVRQTHENARLLVATAEKADLPGVEVVSARGFDAVPRVLAQDSVFAVPRVSWSGYPIKLLNAMAAGKAIVACEGAAYPITHEHDGLVVPDNDERAFANALLRLMDDPELRAELGKNARATILEKHCPETTAERLEAIAYELVDGHAPE